ncbi:type VI secretion system Vgr family protein [Cupriavidus sp. NPDC089707]|uniref:type VI secretion system Vgr family protein n=1 Tax=Cupriavidus sp. NPDC089707 TaxID=3363963 RepID=UPI0037F3C70D
MRASFNLPGVGGHTVTLKGEGLPEQLGRSAFTVVRVEGQENLCELFEYRVTLKTPDSLNTVFGPAANLNMPALQGRELTIGIQLDGMGSALAGGVGAGTREITGLVTQVEGPANVGRSLAYTLTLRPWLFLASQTSDFKIFQQKTVVEILDELLADYTFPVEKRLDLARYPKREYQVQYGETDYAFFKRLTEEWGIAFFFEHSHGKHRLVLTDGNGAFRKTPSAAYHTVQWHDSVGRIDEEHVYDFTVIDKLGSGAWVSNDYDFNKPRADLHIGVRNPRNTAHADGEIYEWPGDHAQPVTGNDPWKEGDFVSGLRMEELRQHGSRACGKGNLRGLAAGCTFTLIRHPQRKANVEYLTYAAQLKLEEVAEESGQDQHWKCEVAFEVQPAKVTFRPARLQEKPRTFGPQTATVVGPQSRQAWLDEFGRVRIQLHWDRIGQRDENTSCWVRVSQAWQGDQFGASHIPRIGQEVIVDFLNGDPDCPIITGRVPNRVNMPQWVLPSQHALSGFRSKELFGERHNTFLQDDTQGQIQTQIGSDHQMSLLSLGYITRVPDADGRKDMRGEGFELRTDGHGAIRSAKGMLVSTEARHDAKGHHKDMGEAVQRLTNGRDVQGTLGECADQQQAQAGEQLDVAKALKAQNDAIRGNGERAELSEPHLVLASPCGIAVTTAETTHLHSGRHTAITTGAHLSIATGGGFFGSFSERAVLFAQKLGVRLFAAKGKIEIQAQSDDIEIIARKVLKLISASDLIEIAARKEIVLNGGGSYIRIDGSGIEHGASGDWKAYAGSHGLPGSRTLAQSLPPVPQGAPGGHDQAFVATWAGTDLPASGVAYRLRDNAGKILTEGITGKQGETSLSRSQVPDGLAVELFDKRGKSV